MPRKKPTPPLPVTVLSGFLGAGKTTVTPPGGRTLALVVGVGLDAEALRRQAEEHFTA